MKWFRKKKVIYFREGPAWIEKIRLYISTKLLNFAEKLPEVKAGYWHQLQYVRKSQRHYAEKNFKEFQIPNNTDIKLLGFRLAELFHIEDFKYLKNNLQSLFPDAAELLNRNYERLDGDISYGGWQRQGYLVPKGKNSFIFAEQTAVLENLSTDISQIELSTHQITSSLISLNFDVRLTKKANNKFIKFFRKKYLYPTKLGWYRKKSDFLPYNGTWYINSGVEIEFRKWCEELQLNIEKNIQDYFSGYFNSEVTEKIKLPRIDVFVIEDPSVEKDESDLNNRNWKQSLGLAFPDYIDENNKSSWIFKEKRFTTSWPTRVIIDLPSFINGKDVKAYHGNDNYIWSHMTEFFMGTAMPYMLMEYFEIERKKITRIRQQVFQQKNVRMKLNLNKLLRLFSIVQSNSIKLNRVLMEFDIISEYMENISDKYTKPFLHNYYKDRYLSKTLNQNVKYHKEMLLKHNEFLQTTINQIINFSNLRATRRVTLVSIFIAVISVVIAIIALNLDWSSVLDFFKTS